MADEELFKTTLMGGYDKDEVARQIQKMKDEAYVEKSRLLQILKNKDKQIDELKEKVAEQESELKQKDRDIREKYQSYKDNYETIGRLIYESRLQADRMIKEAREQGKEIIRDAQMRAKNRLDQVQGQIDEKLEEGQKKYSVIQKELEEILDLFNQVQKKCIQSYETVHELVKDNDSENPFAVVYNGGALQDDVDQMREQLEKEIAEEDDSLDDADAEEDLDVLEKGLPEYEDEQEDELTEEDEEDGTVEAAPETGNEKTEDNSDAALDEEDDSDDAEMVFDVDGGEAMELTEDGKADDDMKKEEKSETKESEE